MKSCFYPLIGDRIFGWPGDLVDILRCSTNGQQTQQPEIRLFSCLSVIATLFGVCTSLGLGTMQINRGLHLLNSSIPVDTGEWIDLVLW